MDWKQAHVNCLGAGTAGVRFTPYDPKDRPEGRSAGGGNEGGGAVDIDFDHPIEVVTSSLVPVTFTEPEKRKL